MARKPDVVVPMRRRPSMLDGVPEVEMPLAPADVASVRPVSDGPAIDLSERPKVWFVCGPGGAGKTTYAKWLVARMMERGGEALLAALDPTNRSLASWFDGVEQPPTRDSAHTARWLREFLEHLMTERSAGVLDFGGGDVALHRSVDVAPDLVATLETAGLAVVAAYLLTPRIDDLAVLQTMEAVGFQPRATLLVLNEGRADPTLPPAEAFAAITRHSIFRNTVARGAVPIWLPALESDVMGEIEAKRLHYATARDGQVPAGASFPPIGGLRRSMVNRWLQRMEQAHEPVHTWLL
jgi:Zeta toxin